MNAINFLSNITSFGFNISKEQTPPLNKVVSYDPTALHRRDVLWICLMFAPAVVALVAAVATAALSSIPLGLSASIFALGLWATSFFLSIDKICDNDSSYKMRHLNEGIIKHMNNVPDEELASRLKSLGIAPGLPPEKLKAAYAHFLYYKDAQTQAMKSVEYIEDKINDIFKPDVPSKIKSEVESELLGGLHRMQSRKERYINEAAEANLNAAYVLKTLQSPYEKRELKDFVDVSQKSYSKIEMAKIDTNTLSQRIFELPKRWYQIL